MSDNTQHKLNNTRPPRVQITYDVMVGNATEHKELPFVVAIMADLSGMCVQEPPVLKDRSFVGIYSDNMNDIMAHIKPSLNLAVENRLLNNKGKFKANLVFETMDDFHPTNLIKQIPTLASLYESRVNLKDLLSKMDGNDELEDMLFKIMQDPKMQDTLMSELESESPHFKNAESHEQKIAQETMEILSEVKVSQDVSRDEIHHETELFESPYTDEKQVAEIISDVSLKADDVSHVPEKQDKTDERKNTNDFF